MTGQCENSIGIHLVNVEQRKAAADNQTKSPDLGCESASRLLSCTTTIAIYYYYSARKLILLYRPTDSRRLGTARKVHTARAQEKPVMESLLGSL